MSDQRHWQAYDIFKLIVAIILGGILLLLFFRSTPDVGPTPTPPTENTTVVSTVMPTGKAVSTVTPSTTPTGTQSLTPTATPTWTPTPTPTASVTPTFTPSATFTPTLTPTKDICSLALKSQLEIGKIARVKTDLNFRVAPGLDQKWILTHLYDTRVEIIGGPVCTPYLNGAYMWWQVRRLSDGSTGWSAEGSAISSYYFLEPVE